MIALHFLGADLENLMIQEAIRRSMNEPTHTENECTYEQVQENDTKTETSNKINNL
jgi:hypothetical protein